MSYIQRPMRLLSNKENSLYTPLPAPGLDPSPSGPSMINASNGARPSSSKPRMGGIGPSPKRRTHLGKPYSRSGSIHRHSKHTHTLGKKKILAAPKMTSPPTQSAPPLDTLAAVATSTTSLLSVPTHSHSLAKTSQKSQSQPSIRYARLPMKLTKPKIPAVTDLGDDVLTDVPLDYALPRILSTVASLGIVSSQYRPYECVNTPSPLGYVPRENNTTITFGVPAIVFGNDEGGRLAKIVAGREPDICLAIVNCDKQNPIRPKLVPVNHLVFTSQAAFFGHLVKYQHPAGRPASPVTQPAGPLLSIEEGVEDGELVEGAADESSPSDHSSPGSPTASQAHSDTTASAATTSTQPGTTNQDRDSSPLIELPIVSLPLPSPETYSVLHMLLHFAHPSHAVPQPNLLPHLLNIITPAELDKLHDNELMQRLRTLHGVWKNLCHLGVSNDRVWWNLGDAWAKTMKVVAGRVIGEGFEETTRPSNSEAGPRSAHGEGMDQES